MSVAGTLVAICGNCMIGTGQTLQKAALDGSKRTFAADKKRGTHALLPTGRRVVSGTLPSDSGPRQLHRRGSEGSELKYSGKPARSPQVSTPVLEPPPRYKSPMWLLGMFLATCGELANWSALTIFDITPAIVAPLGIVSVVVGTFLGGRVLGEPVGPRQRMGVLWIGGGVFAILLSVPQTALVRSPDKIARIVEILDPRFSLYVTICLSLSIFLVWMAFIVGYERAEIFCLIVAVYGGVTVVSSKSLAYAPSPTTATFLVISLALQEVFRQQALSRFSLTQFQPLLYACHNTISVLSSSIVFDELKDATHWETARFLAGFIVGLGLVVHGIRRLQSEDVAAVGSEKEKTVMPTSSWFSRRASIYLNADRPAAKLSED
ncbi:hypothetical protein M427DRAFT_59882 [Gonapodya prolifera JEL478]|uniref:DUF803-domain-containing protein n=1 Tax=Gonapodya prolifera (strain JEL478) TaxID=1344416 RepID=A0A139A6P5_GONPJ|nr:hypothetical protein M427DRAFT_59882 [Gonapodya prolifera JEL478]|eukprot:KXS12013.1 hypothetical protein M427DRAFT_59882 [Gonapodya prolifera JEL478]